MKQAISLTDTLQALITDEFMTAMGFKQTHWSKPAIHAVVKKGTRHFADLCTQLDADIAMYGITQAARRLAPNFIVGCFHHGTEHIPCNGPLLITSNHPGAADAVTILALTNRDDVKIVLTGVPYTKALPNAQSHFIHVTPDTNVRSQVIRDIISHLKNEGAVFIFPTGHVTPDPELNPNESLVFEGWSESIALIMRSVPEANLLVTVISGVIEQRFLNSPICKLRRIKWRQQILAEFMQIIWQMMHPTGITTQPRVTFVPPVTGRSLLHLASNNHKPTRQALHDVILRHAVEGLKIHADVKDTTTYTAFP